MKIKDMLFPVAFALLVTWMIQYWFFGSKKAPVGVEAVRSGQSFVAPETKQEIKPLNKEIDFIDEKRLWPRVETECETPLATYTFSNHGASLERLEYRGTSNGKLAGLGTVFPVSDTQRENKCFMLALEEKTPYFYKFIGKDEDDCQIEVKYRYESPNSDFIIDKKFTVYKRTYKVDLDIDVTSKKELKEEDGFSVRLFFPAPLMPELGKKDVISAVFNNEKGAVEKKTRAKLEDNRGWLKPKIFGADSKYFLHTMTEEDNKFIKRAYYKKIDTEKLFSILEGPTTNTKQDAKISFYFGPKEEKALAMVDPRLEGTLEYSGWFAPISKFLLKILKFLYGYVKNYGWAIILLTLMIRLLMLPFSIRAEKGMKKRLEFQKKLEYLQSKYKHDKAALARERAELIRKNGMPGLGGCLPLLLQIPIFFALSNLLRSSIELYKAPFILWIKDLSAPDPYYVLPALMSLAMLGQAFTVDPKQRFMMIAMALAIGPLFATFPAGLGLYIAASVGLGVLQSFLVKKFKSA